jgi:hypothetical protein
MTECINCGGNGFIRQSDQTFQPCPLCIVPDITDVVAVENKRTQVLSEASRLINGDRAETHGSAADTFKTISEMWSAYLKTKVTPTDVAQMMVLLKVVRGQANNKHVDDFVVQAGYSALGFVVAV